MMNKAPITKAPKVSAPTQAWAARPRKRRVVERLMNGVSARAAALIIATLPLAQPAWANGVNGTPTISFGADAPTRTATSDSFNVTASDALIDWSANDTGGVFLPDGHALNFTSTNSTPYTVLNRVANSAAGALPLQINGAVNADANGRIWFYNPTGWVAGGTSVFNVGSLLLTANPITIDTTRPDGQKFVGDHGEIRLGDALNPGAGVSIRNGAQINALAAGSYIALVAPRVEQGGTVTVNGSAAYVGAEAATLTVNNGLFDISVDTGTTDANGVVHTGTTTGPAGSSSDPNHGVYLVAVPKNNLTTMLVSGSIGYAPADTVANEVDGTIVLSSGYGVSGGQATFGNTPTGAGGSITISGLNASNTLTAVASERITVDATAASTTIGGTATLNARNTVELTATGGQQQIGVTGDLSINVTNGTDGGTLNLTASNGGQIGIGGTLNAVAQGNGGIEYDGNSVTALRPGSVGNDGNGGTITVNLNNGGLTVGSAAFFNVDAISGIGAVSAGRATAGSISVTQTGANARMRIGDSTPGTLSLSSQARRGDYQGYYLQDRPVTGSSSASGALLLDIQNGAFSAGQVQFTGYAEATGGTDLAPQDASVGDITARFSNGSYQAAGLQVRNDAYATDGGAASAGDIALTVDRASLTLTTQGYYSGVYVNSDIVGTQATPRTVSLAVMNGGSLTTDASIYLTSRNFSPAEGMGRSGSVSVVVDNGSTLQANSLDLTSYAEGGTGAINAASGNVSFTLSGGSSATFSSNGYGGLSLTTSANGANGDDAGDGLAGDASLAISDSSLITDSLSVSAQGYGGYAYVADGRSGVGRGGNASITLDGDSALLRTPSVTIDSLGDGRTRSEGFAAAGIGGFGAAPAAMAADHGKASAGLGGSSTLTVNGGQMTVDTLYVGANAFGGDGYASSRPGSGAVDGGDAIGGTATIDIYGGAVSATSVTAEAIGRGGRGSDQYVPYDTEPGYGPGNGGNGTGGSVAIGLHGGQLSTNSLTATAAGNADEVIEDYSGYGYYDPIIRLYGQGGDVFQGPEKGGTGGVGTGGSVSLTVDGGALVDMPDGPSIPEVPLTVSLSASGKGGKGGDIQDYYATSLDGLVTGNGGAGQGGSVVLSLIDGAFDATSIQLESSANGGTAGQLASSSNSRTLADVIAAGGGAGGSGTGGIATFTIARDFAGLTAEGARQDIRVIADGFGESGASGLIGGAGGVGTGGTARIEANSGTVNLYAPNISASGYGGDAGNSSKGYDGAIGGDGTGGRAELALNGDDALVAVAGMVVRASAQGGSGGQGGNGDDAAATIVAGNGGAGGAATGGTASISVSGLSELSLTSGEGTYTFLANAVGGIGGDGGNSAVFDADSVGNGGNGGAATGGNLEITAQNGARVDLGRASFEALGQGGGGGSSLYVDNSFGRGASIGGSGGAGTGGSISLESSGEGSLILSRALTLTANGEGGNAGYSSGNDLTTGAGARGGAGGNATGGSIMIGASDLGTIDFAEETSALFRANGISGFGGDGTAATGSSGARGGDGGDGGTARGGSIFINGDSGATLHIGVDGQTDFIATGFASGGGSGGAGANNSAIGGRGGDGGDGGNNFAGDGGNVEINIAGTSLDFGDVNFNVTGTTQWYGFGAPGGAGGPGSNPQPPAQPVPPGASGNPGGSGLYAPTGGYVRIAAGQDGQGNYSTFSAGNTTLDLTSAIVQYDSSPLGAYASGGVSIENHGGGETGNMTFGSLFVNADGQGYGYYPQVSLLSDGGTLGVANDLRIISAGPTDLHAANNGVIDTAGLLDITSQSDVNFTGENGGIVRAGSVSLYRSGFNFGGVNVYSYGCEVVTCTVLQAVGSIHSNNFSVLGLSDHAGIDAGTTIDIYATDGIGGGTGSAYTAGGAISLTSRGDIFVRNASAQSLTVNAGTPYGFPNPADAIIGEEDGGGRIDTTDFVDIRAGRDIRMPMGNSLSAGSTIYMGSGADIRIAENNSLLAGANDSGGQDRQAGGSFRAPSSLSGITLSAGTNYPPPTNPPSVPATTLFVGSGTSVDAGNGDIRLEGQTIDARGASFFGANFSANVLSTPDPASAGSPEQGACATGSICLGSVYAANAIAIGLGEGGTPLGFLGEGTLSGRTLDIRTVGTLAFDSGTADLTDTIDLQSTGGDIVLGNGANLTAARINLSGAGSLQGGDGFLTATGDDVGLSFGGDISVSGISAARTLTAYHQDPAARFTTPGSFVVNDLTLGGDAAITAGGDLRVGTAYLPGGNIDFVAGGNALLGGAQGVVDLAIKGVDVTLIGVTVGGSVKGTASGALGGNAVKAGTTLALTGASAALGTLESGGALSLDVTGTAQLTSAISGGTLSINAGSLTAPTLTAAGNLSLLVINTAALGAVRSGGNIFIDPVTLTFDSMVSTGSTTLIGGDVLGGTIDAGTGVDVTASGRLRLTGARSGTTMTLKGASIELTGPVSAGGALAATASGRISVGGLTSGQTIALTSGDLDIGASGALGDSTRTGSITLTNNGTGGMALGDGLSAQAGYVLSNAEFGRIHAGGDLTVNAGPSLQVGTLAITAGFGGTAAGAAAGVPASADGQVGPTRSVRLATNGGATVSGAVTFANAAGNTLAIDAGGGIVIDAAAGSITMREGTARGGTLALSGPSVIAATADARGAVGQSTDLATITQRLSANDGLAGRTLIDAGALDVTTSRFLVQNTAAGIGYDDRRGIAVDTLTVRGAGTQSPQPVQIVINGTIGGLTGLAAIPRATINGQFAAGSTINGCALDNVAACSTPANEPPPTLIDDGDVRNVIAEFVSQPAGLVTIPVTGDGFIETPLVQINALTPPGFDPLIDEPVTGTGNDDLLGESTDGKKACEPGEADCRP